MESKVTSIVSLDQSLPSLPTSCPISSLFKPEQMGKRLSEMSEAELEERIKSLRQVRESPHALKTVLLKGVPAKEAKPKKSKVPDLSLLGI